MTLDCADSPGRRFTTKLEHNSPLPEVSGFARLVNSNLGIIRAELGTFGCQMPGYSPGCFTPEKHQNLTAAFVDTEGTSVTILQITVRLVDLPGAPAPVVPGYPDVIAAADDVPMVLKYHPLAVEGLGLRFVDVIRRHNNPSTVPELSFGRDWILYEVGSADLEDSLTKTRALVVSTHVDAAAIYPPRTDTPGL